mmetsp:Transcript_46074/g.147378  ORF Transcript_46074/g.147378 Transcript_46074/m.147378 type:complete len:412 (-) Transcript_46074:1133-2368(-)
MRSLSITEAISCTRASLRMSAWLSALRSPSSSPHRRSSRATFSLSIVFTSAMRALDCAARLSLPRSSRARTSRSSASRARAAEASATWSCSSRSPSTTPSSNVADSASRRRCSTSARIVASSSRLEASCLRSRAWSASSAGRFSSLSMAHSSCCSTCALRPRSRATSFSAAATFLSRASSSFSAATTFLPRSRASASLSAMVSLSFAELTSSLTSFALSFSIIPLPLYSSTMPAYSSALSLTSSSVEAVMLTLLACPGAILKAVVRYGSTTPPKLSVRQQFHRSPLVSGGEAPCVGCGALLGARQRQWDCPEGPPERVRRAPYVPLFSVSRISGQRKYSVDLEVPPLMFAQSPHSSAAKGGPTQHRRKQAACTPLVSYQVTPPRLKGAPKDEGQRGSPGSPSWALGSNLRR